MRHAAGVTFAPQGQPLLDTKAVLLVDDGQPQLGKHHLLLEQCVCADHQLRRAVGDAGHLQLSRFAFLFATQPADADAERRQPAAEGVAVLFGEDLGWRHQRHLVTVANRLQRRQCRHYGLARADIALQQPQHRFGRCQIGGYLCHHALLSGGQRKGQLVVKLLAELWLGGQRRCGVALHPRAQLQHTQLLGNQLFDHQPLLGGVFTAAELAQVGGGGRAMQQLECLQ